MRRDGTSPLRTSNRALTYGARGTGGSRHCIKHLSTTPADACAVTSRETHSACSQRSSACMSVDFGHCGCNSGRESAGPAPTLRAALMPAAPVSARNAHTPAPASAPAVSGHTRDEGPTHAGAATQLCARMARATSGATRRLDAGIAATSAPHAAAAATRAVLVTAANDDDAKVVVVVGVSDAAASSMVCT